MQFKWGNERKQKDKDLPEVQAKKRKHKCVEEAGTQGNVPVLTWGMANYLPPQPVSEDVTSINLHKECMQREYRKSDQNASMIDFKMGITFPARRKQIIEENLGVRELLLEYPYLQSRRQVRFDSYSLSS